MPATRGDYNIVPMGSVATDSAASPEQTAVHPSKTRRVSGNHLLGECIRGKSPLKRPEEIPLHG